MVQDEIYDESKGKQVIEVLIEDGGIKVWCPVMAMDLRSMTRDYELNHVKAVRVRKL